MSEAGAFDCFRIHYVRLKKIKIDALYECCNAFYKNSGDDATTVSCPKPDLLRSVYHSVGESLADLRRLKIKQRSQGVS